MLIFFSIWTNDPVFADDFIAGTVLSIDIDKLEITLIPGPPEQSLDDAKKSITARLNAENLVVNKRGDRVFPGCVFPGGMVRIWGHMDEGIFMVTDIRGYGGRGQADPTGVHRRLQRIGPGYCPDGPGFHGGRP
jgi:hypothetical protein